MHCDEPPVATISLRYAARRVVIGELLPERDPNLLDLCARHVSGMTPPVGWSVDETRAEALVAPRA
jgi:Protein of unknown function (DUF3499)